MSAEESPVLNKVKKLSSSSYKVSSRMLMSWQISLSPGLKVIFLSSATKSAGSTAKEKLYLGNNSDSIIGQLYIVYWWPQITSV